MEIAVEHEVRTAVLDADHAIDRDVIAALDADAVELVRVPEPPLGMRSKLRAAGFVLAPSWINWGAELNDEAGFFACLPASERRDLRAARRHVERSNIMLVCHDPLNVTLLDRFLALYREQIATMSRGVPYAAEGRVQLLDLLPGVYGVFAYCGKSLLGGVLCVVQEDRSVARLAFSAVTPSARDGLLVRALYDAAFRRARERCLQWMSLGTDPCLYGQLTRPGLFRFKARLGFVPIPLQAVDADDGSDEAIRVLRIADLAEPSLLVRYHCDDDSRATGIRWDRPVPLTLDVLTTTANIDLRPFRAPFLQAIETRVLPRRVR